LPRRTIAEAEGSGNGPQPCGGNGSSTAARRGRYCHRFCHHFGGRLIISQPTARILAGWIAAF